MKKLLVKLRTSVKFLVLVSIATLLIVGAVILFYKPIYSVTLDGEIIGYCVKKNELQKRINDYIENGDGKNKNLAFISIDEMPTYKMCLLKRGITTNDEEIYKTITDMGVAYYRYYAILEDDEEKVYVSDFKTAEKVVKELKKKNSNNINEITIEEKYETELEGFTKTDKAIAKLYEKKVIKPKVTTTRYATTGRASTSRKMSQGKVALGVSLARPITGIITSRFGHSSSIRSGAHTGLDIAASTGTSIKAAASGTVTFSGWKGAYGYMVVVSHGKGVQTYYAHCSKLYVKAGDKIQQGQRIAAVGSTGNSTGPHLHLEVRVNGVAYNPQNYVY